METAFTGGDNSSTGLPSTQEPNGSEVLTVADGPTEIPYSAIGTSPTLQVATLLVRILWAVLAFVGNGITVAAVVRFEYLRTSTNYLIGALAAADLLSSVCPFLLLAQHLVVANSGRTTAWLNICVTERTIGIMTSGLNILIIMWISVDRFVYITRPLLYPLLVTPARVVKIICATWLYAFGQCFLYAMLGFFCTTGASIIITGQFFIYTVVIVALYSRIGCVAYRQSQRVQPGQMVNTENQRRERKITKMMAMVLGVYLVAYAPQIIILLWIRLRPKYVLLLHDMEKVSRWIWWINSWANPLIYAWRSKQFKRAFRQLLGIRTTGVQNVLPVATTF